MKRILTAVATLLLCVSTTNAQDESTEPGSWEIYPESQLYNQFSTHREAEQHYYHCELNNFQLNQELGKYIGPVGDCQVSESWGGGDLWKPVSDNTGNPVVLTAADTRNARCEIITPTETLPCRFRTIANGNRAHWDVFRRCGNLDSPLIFRLEIDGVGHCWEVGDPCQRHE